MHIETPGNPTLTISDIRAIADIAHENGALLSVDNTFASPYNQRPIELGADFTVESLTKYINGHGDAMGGAIIGKKKYLDIIRAQSQVNLGATISPFNAWLIMRGAVTLPLRMRQHNANALQVANTSDGGGCRWYTPDWKLTRDTRSPQNRCTAVSAACCPLGCMPITTPITVLSAI